MKFDLSASGGGGSAENAGTRMTLIFHTRQLVKALGKTNSSIYPLFNYPPTMNQFNFSREKLQPGHGFKKKSIQFDWKLTDPDIR